MTRDDVIRVAREAGMAPHLGRTDDDGKYIPAINAIKTSVPVQWLERFAALVAAVEREACAQVCDGVYYRHIGPESGEVRYGVAACAEAIRASCSHQRCPECGYQHGHAIGCVNNPVDIALSARWQDGEVKVEPPIGWSIGFRSPECWCETCDTAANHGLRSRMSLCPRCGNKRCPRATHHDNACTASNHAKQIHETTLNQ